MKNLSPMELNPLFDLLKKKRGIDFSGNRSEMLQRLVLKRMLATKCAELNEYFIYLQNHDKEADRLLDVFIINVSRFFRNSLTFEIIGKNIIPALFQEKQKTREKTIRVWSAGCAGGEEPFSVAILFHEYMKKNTTEINLRLFASDLDTKALQKAAKGVYVAESLEEVKHGRVMNYFTQKGDAFCLKEEIKKMATFSRYDLLDKNSYTLPESVFGEFDMVFCRNVLIYFELEYQKIIFDKLYKSLKPGGYLILGEAEAPVEGFKNKFSAENQQYRIYQKREVGW
jgi:chemotaxis protein methyltransferase CheR